jgi:hypothetical protein
MCAGATVEQILESTREDVARTGWSTFGVFPTQENPIVSFTYTIGLGETFDHPELIIYGLGVHAAWDVLACAVDLIRAGTRLEPGRRYGEVMSYRELPGDYDVEVRAHPSDPLSVASGYYGREVEAVQIVWPDPEGRFPDEEGVELYCATAQLVWRNE